MALRNFKMVKLHPKLISSISIRELTSAKDVEYDLVVVGGGIIGVATSREILIRHPNLRMAILEKEEKLATHQTGHNSGVIHAGIYYTPGSLKAKLCTEGADLTYKYADANDVPYKKVGKLIVATNETEIKRLDDLYNRGKENNVRDLEIIEGKRIREFEPNCTGVKALWSPHTGIIDWALMTKHYGQDFTKAGGKIIFNFQVDGFKECKSPEYPVLVTGKGGKMVSAKYVLTCGGLYSDKLAVMSGCSPSPKIVPFRGEYLLMNKSKQNIVKTNIYPVPDPRFPFLGVHFTPRIDGSMWLGPNAVLAFKREGYSSWFDINIPEILDTLLYRGFRKLSLKYFTYGVKEAMKSLITPLQIKDLQKFVPTVTAEDVIRGPAGVRAQALSEDGELVDDFYFDRGTGPISQRILHCRNAPSPGATSSLSIAKMLADKMEEEFLTK